MIEYIDESHTYLNSEGIVIPSVSNLVEFATEDTYRNVPGKVLKQAQDYGTEIHKAIEVFLNDGVITEFKDIRKKLSMEQFFSVYQEYVGEEVQTEVMVDYEQRYGGRFDCLSGEILIDWKTNAQAPVKKLEWQMAYYKLGLEQQGKRVSKCMALWLPKGKAARWIEITPKSKEEAIANLERYEDEQKSRCHIDY